MDLQDMTDDELVRHVNESVPERTSLEILLAARLADALAEVDVLTGLVLELQGDR